MTPPPTALILDFGGVISRTMFETHDVTERALGLRPGTLTWRGPLDPGTDALWASMQTGAISERDYWLTRTRETGALIGERWERMEEFVKPVALIGRMARFELEPSALPAGKLLRFMDFFTRPN